MVDIEEVGESTGRRISRFHNEFDRCIEPFCLGSSCGGDKAERDDVLRFAEEINEGYASLLDVQKIDQSEVDDRILYDLDRAELVSNCLSKEELSTYALTTGIALGVSLVINPAYGMFSPFLGFWQSYETAKCNANGRYSWMNKGIGVSSEKEVEDHAYSLLASEMLHFYQDEKNSGTWSNPVLHEGMDAAVSIKQLGNKDGVDEELYELYRTSCMIKGYVNYKSIVDQVDKEDLRSLGLDGPEAERFIKLEGDSVSKEYYVGACSIWAAEEYHGEGVYSDIFQGDFSLLEDLDELEKGMPLISRLI